MNCLVACLIAFAPVVSGVSGEPRPLRAQAASAEERCQYADREAASPAVLDFEGGEVYISLTALVLIFLLCYLLFLQH